MSAKRTTARASARKAPVTVETTPTVEAPVTVETTPTVEAPVTVETTPTVEAPVTVETTPTVEAPVTVETTPTVEAPASIPAHNVTDRAMAFVEGMLRPHFGDAVRNGTLATVREGLERGNTVLALRKPFEILVTDFPFTATHIDFSKHMPGRVLFNISASLLSARLYGMVS